MPRSVEYAARALRNLENIKTYISKDNPAAAERVVVHIAESADGLMDFPLTGKPWLRAGTRKLTLAKYPYSIIYKLTPTRVVVLAVAHQSQKFT